MFYISRYLKVVVLTAFFAVFMTSSAVASEDGARDFIQNISDSALGLVGNATIADSDKEKRLDALFQASVDTPWIAKFVLGRYWKDATNEQKTEYTELYKLFLINSYVPKFREYNNQKLNLKNVISESSTEFVVQTEIEAENGAPVRVDYKVRQDGRNFKIYDIVAEGVSLITTQRSEFSSILSRNGVQDLIEKLRAKVKS